MFNVQARIRATLSDRADPAVMPRLMAFLQTRGVSEADTTLLASDVCWRGVTTAQAIYRDDVGDWWIATATNDVGGAESVTPDDEWHGYAESVDPDDAQGQVGVWLAAMAEACGVTVAT